VPFTIRKKNRSVLDRTEPVPPLGNIEVPAGMNSLFGSRHGGSFIPESMSSDAELLQRYTSELAEDAFAELVRRHITLVYSAALRHLGGDAHLAQDVTQTVFTDLARKASALTGRAALAGWLYLAAHHAAAEIVRADRRRRNREQEAHAMQELIAVSPADDWERVRPVLDAAMLELSQTDREAVLLRYFEQRSYADVGAVLNLTVDAARMRVDRALEKLRVLLGRRGITSTGAALGAALANQAVALPAELIGNVTDAALLHGGAPVAAKAGGAGNFSIMNLPSIAISTVAIVALVSAVYLAREARRAESATQSVLQETATLRARLRSAEDNLAKTSAQLADARSQSAAANVAAADSAPPKAAMAGSAGYGSGGVATWGFRSSDGTLQESTSFVDTPEGRRGMYLNAAEATYAAFFRQLGWNDQQRDVFKAMIADRQELGRELVHRAMSGGGAGSRELARNVTEQTTLGFEGKLAAVFGDSVVAALRDFEAKKPLRNIADNLARKLFYSEAPLSAVQADQLVGAMANVARTPEGKIDFGALTSGGLIAQAQAVLRPNQMAALRELEAQRLQQREMEERIRAERANAGGGTTPSR
jgi:RNA polymerase sigma factor (sigma-70 family)